MTAPSPSPTVSAVVPPTPPSAEAPAGRILFHRVGSGEKEEYFTIRTDGTDRHSLFTYDECQCARWSSDASRVWTVGQTDHGTWSLSMVNPDGSDPVVVSPPSDTLNLFVGPATPDGTRITFAGHDETDESRAGIYVASPDLSDVTLVTGLPEGATDVEPFAITPDGEHILMFTNSRAGEHHAGDLFVVESDGSGLRMLNPAGTTHHFEGALGGSLSPDGESLAFAVSNGTQSAVFVADIAGGDARQITDWAGFTWSVGWSPTGDWIAYTQQYVEISVQALVRPDGTGQKEITAKSATDEAAAGTWSPTGEHLLVLRGDDGAWDLWILDLEGNFVGQVTDEPADYFIYGWAPLP